jgi:hypothetical protein
VGVPKSREPASLMRSEMVPVVVHPDVRCAGVRYRVGGVRGRSVLVGSERGAPASRVVKTRLDASRVSH